MGCQQIRRERPGGGKRGVKIVRSNFHRETRENREKFYDLFLCVRTVRVLRGLCNSKGLSVIIRYNSNRERRESRERSYGLFVPFVWFAVHVSKPECPQ